MLGGFFGVENRAAMFAHRDAGLHLLAARGAIGETRGHVRPLAFDAQRDRGAPVQIRNFAEGVPARLHRVALGDEPVIVGIAPRGGRREFFGGGPLARANENSVLAQVLHQILGDVAS